MTTHAAPGHGQNRNGPNSAKKAGGNKGIKAERQAQKRAEAEERNSKTPIERTRAYRRRLWGEVLADAA